MTGITGVSKESIFSDLNNLKVVTTTSDEYGTIQSHLIGRAGLADMTLCWNRSRRIWKYGFAFEGKTVLIG